MNFKELYICFATIFYKEVRRYLRIWSQTLLPPAITMTLYFVIFGNLIGPRIGQMNGFTYIEFIVPGLIMMSVITNSFANVASSFFSTKYQRSHEELVVSPAPNSIIILGYVLGSLSRAILTGIIVTLVALFFTQLTIHSLPIIILVVILTSIVFALGGLLNAILATKFDDISIIPTFVLTPLTYLGGVFYSISLLPPLWQNISLFNPILYMVNTFRYGFLGISDVSVTFSLVTLAALAIVLFLTVLYLMNRGIGLKS